MSTTIEWTQRPGTKGETWNPTTGCAKVSAGCKNCYAEKMHARLTGMGSAKYKEPFTTVRTWDDALRIPLKWKKPRTVFVNSMSDLFHADVPFDFIDKVFTVMSEAHRHTFLILTKRPERMAQYLHEHRANHYRIGFSANDVAQRAINWPLKNVWLGTSVENQQTADERIPHLLNCPAAVRFLSCEPLLGAVELPMEHLMKWAVIDGKPFHKINWVIAGGESGPKARPMHPEWVRGLRDRCKEAGVAFFFKQWGEYGTEAHLWNGTPTFFQFYSFQNWVHKAGAWMRGNICVDTKGRELRIGADFMKARDEDAFPVVLLKKMGKHNSGRLLDGMEHSEFPQS